MEATNTIAVANHEVWMVCPVCGYEYDARMGVCDTCGSVNN